MRKTLTALSIVLVLLGAACSDDDDGGEDVTAADEGDGTSSSTDGADEPSGEGRAVDVVANDFSFDPSTIEAEPGEVLSITLTNEGEAPHTFTTEDGDVDEEVEAGDSATFDVTVPDSGTLAFECRFHAGTGMAGTIGAEDDAAGVQGTEIPTTSTAPAASDY